MGCFSSKDRQRRVVQKPDLLQHRRLIPVDVLVGKFAFAKSYDGNQRYFNTSVCGRDAGQHPGHLLGVGEGEDQLVDQLVLSYRARNERECGVGRHAGDELAAIKEAQGILASATGHYRHMIYMCIVNHRGQCRFHVARGELMPGVLFP